MEKALPVRSVLVLGGGSAGFLAAITLKAKIRDLPVTVLRSKDIGIIGVGEGTTPAFPQHLHDYLGIPLKDFYAQADPQWKLGIRFIWGPRPFFDYAFGYQLDTQYQALKKGTGYYCRDGDWSYVGMASGLMSHNRVFLPDQSGRPIIGGDVTYHMENEKLVAFLETVAARLGVVVRDDTVLDVMQDEDGLKGLRLASGATAKADLYVDCSGFASLLLGRTLQEPFASFKSTLFCSKAVVGGWDRSDEPIKPYTTAETMDAGWCWQIDHERRINRGYVYCDSFISDGDAEAEFRRKNPKVQKTRLVKFTTGRYERAWVKNVVAVGNAAGFVEPLEATSLGAICVLCQALTETIADGDRLVRPAIQEQFNKRNGASWDQIRDFLGVHYRFNTRLDTPFWRECREKSDLGAAAELVEYYRQAGPSILYRSTLLREQDQFGMEGYLSMLVGQQVPYEQPYRPDQAELAMWGRIQQAIRNKVTRAYSPEQAMQIVRHPQWLWPEGVYQSRQSIR